MDKQKIILRKCEGCKQLINRQDMIKITYTKTPEAGLVINPDSKTMGRSMYVCKAKDCIKNVLKKKRVCHALKCKNSTDIEKAEKYLSEFI